MVQNQETKPGEAGRPISARFGSRFRHQHVSKSRNGQADENPAALRFGGKSLVIIKFSSHAACACQCEMAFEGTVRAVLSPLMTLSMLGQ